MIWCRRKRSPIEGAMDWELDVSDSVPCEIATCRYTKLTLSKVTSIEALAS